MVPADSSCLSTVVTAGMSTPRSAASARSYDSGPELCSGLARGVSGGGRAGRVVHPGHGVGVLDAHLALQAVRVSEEDAEDGAEIGDEVIAGAPGDQPVPDLVERVDRRGLQSEMVDAAPPEHRR